MLLPKKLLIAWEFKHQLSFYGVMDAIGLEFRPLGFEDWKRSALNLEVQDLSAHRLVNISTNQFVYQHDWQQDWDIPQSVAMRVSEQLSSKLHVSSLKRLILRNTYALDTVGAFESAVASLQRRVFSNNPALDEVNGDGAKLFDLAYFANSRFPDGMETHLNIGIMRREEWTTKVDYELALYKGDALRKKLATIPEPLMFFHWECIFKEITLKESPEKLSVAIERQQRSVRRFIEYYKHGK